MQKHLNIYSPKMVSCMDIPSLLEDIGFSKGEAVVYLALLRLGPSMSGNIIKTTSMQSSVVHNCLNTLINKGFVRYILQGAFKRYAAIDPALIEKFIASKQEQFRRALPQLLHLQSSTSAIPTAAVYEGIKGMITATHDMLESSKKGQSYKFFAFALKNQTKEILSMCEKIDLVKKEKGVKIFGIAENNCREALRGYSHSKIKFTRQKIPQAMNIYQDKVLIMSGSEKPVGILITSKEIAHQYHSLWDALWETARD